MHRFNTYSDAATFARQAAKEKNVPVRIKRQDEIFVVEIEPDRNSHTDVDINKHIEMDIQIDGETIVRWIAGASSDALLLLALAEYSDSDDIFVIHAAQQR